MLLDIILVVILLGYIGQGWKDGFIHTAGRVVGAVLGFILARSWSLSIAFIFQILLPAGWARFIAFIAIFILVNRLVGWAFKLAESAFKIISFIPFLKSINNLLGAILGIFEGFIILGGCIWVIENFDLVAQLKTWIEGSHVAPFVSHVFQLLLGVLL
jgi:uncharacterized membrane protein required for colicin V production